MASSDQGPIARLPREVLGMILRHADESARLGSLRVNSRFHSVASEMLYAHVVLGPKWTSFADPGMPSSDRPPSPLRPSDRTAARRSALPRLVRRLDIRPHSEDHCNPRDSLGPVNPDPNELPPFPNLRVLRIALHQHGKGLVHYHSDRGNRRPAMCGALTQVRPPVLVLRPAPLYANIPPAHLPPGLADAVRTFVLVVTQNSLLQPHCSFSTRTLLRFVPPHTASVVVVLHTDSRHYFHFKPEMYHLNPYNLQHREVISNWEVGGLVPPETFPVIQRLSKTWTGDVIQGLARRFVEAQACAPMAGDSEGRGVRDATRVTAPAPGSGSGATPTSAPASRTASDPSASVHPGPSPRTRHGWDLTIVNADSVYPVPAPHADEIPGTHGMRGKCRWLFAERVYQLVADQAERDAVMRRVHFMSMPEYLRTPGADGVFGQAEARAWRSAGSAPGE